MGHALLRFGSLRLRVGLMSKASISAEAGGKIALLLAKDIRNHFFIIPSIYERGSPTQIARFQCPSNSAIITIIIMRPH